MHYQDVYGVDLSQFQTIPPRHLAIIMDGNGRWAKKRGMPRAFGHKNGVEAVRRIVKSARNAGIKYLTLYSFSTENWSRPPEEIDELMSLLKIFVKRDLAELHQNNVKIRIIGDKKNLKSDIIELLEKAETLTAQNTAQTLVIAFNYGARSELVSAMQALGQKIASGRLSPEQIDEKLISAGLFTADIPDPDLIVRTSGEQRLSNFLLWQAAYSELVFCDCLWPDFDETQLEAVLEEYSQRQRRYGGIGQDADAHVGS